MLNKLPIRFFSTGDCGCGSAPSNGGDTPASPGRNTICDDRFYGMIEVPRLRILGVVPGSNCQAFLHKLRGFAMDDGSGVGAYIAKRPDWDLPLLNPFTAGAYPAPAGGFPFLVTATGDLENTPWSFLRAPTAGAYVLQTENGVFVLKDAGQIPGLNSVCSQVNPATTVNLAGCAQTGTDGNGNPIFSLKKLLVIKNAPVVGYEDPGDNSLKHRSLPLNVAFEHPEMKPDKLNSETYVQRDPASDVEYTGGLLVLPRTGPEAPGDAVPGYYSPTTKKFYRSPAHVRAIVHQQTTSNVTLNGTYQAVSGHLNWGSIDFQYPNAEVTWNAAFNTSERVNWGLFVDGNLVKEWRYAGTASGVPSVVGGSHIVTGLTPGNHTFELRVQGTSAGCALEFSTGTLKTLTD